MTEQLTLTKAAARKRLAIFLLITFGLTWSVDFAAGLALGTFETGINSSQIMIGIVAVSMFFPLAGAFAANALVGPTWRRDLALKPRISENIRLYLLAWFGPAVVSLLGMVLFFLANQQLFDPTMMSYLESAAAAAGVPLDKIIAEMPPMPILLSTTLFAALGIAPLINMIPAFGEEVGWRGMLFPTLCELMSPCLAAVVSGIIWGLWHAPIIAMGHNYGMNYAGFPWAGILVMILACTALGVIFAYLRLRTNSVWPCALAHGAVNAIANIGVVFCTAGQTLFGPSPLGLIGCIPVVVLAGICLRRMGK